MSNANRATDLENRAQGIIDGLKNLDEAFHYSPDLNDMQKKFVMDELLNLVLEYRPKTGRGNHGKK